MRKSSYYTKILQLASNESTVTFQHNYGILWGVNLNIQTVLLRKNAPQLYGLKD